MSRFVILAALAALVLAVPATHDAFAAKEDKVLVCHLNSSNTPATYEYEFYYYEYYFYWLGGGYGPYEVGPFSGEQTVWFGNVIEVAESAVAAHVGHGDSTGYGTLTDDLIEYFESWDTYDYDYEYEIEIDDLPWYYYHYHAIDRQDYTNGEVKNADCFFYTHN